MTTRTVALALATLCLFACGESASVNPGPLSDKSQDDSAPDKSSSSAGGTSTSTTTASTLDGTWDITTAGLGGSLGASSMTVKGGTINGVIDAGDEGTQDDVCVFVTDTTTFKIVLDSDTMIGTFTHVATFTEPEFCGAIHSVSTVTATRTGVGSKTSGATAFEGEWQINDSDGTPRVAFTVAGLAAKVWGAYGKDNGDAPIMSGNVVSGAVRTTSTEDGAPLTFAARKRQ